jgi:hypothetical protein
MVKTRLAVGHLLLLCVISFHSLGIEIEIREESKFFYIM